MPPKIKNIDKNSVYKICSGQVILDLSLAVKELLENSIDAGCSAAEVKLYDYGVALVEVSDNGSGIDRDDYARIATKHATSKINDFGDLTALQTFGFRGEALSSLSAMGDLTVETATENECPKGSRLVFDKLGNLAQTVTIARDKGTTVKVANLFHSMPVRLAEFKRNKKREYAKCVTLLQAYAITYPNVRFQVSLAESKSFALKTSGIVSNPTATLSESMQTPISAIFGPKLARQLLAIDLQLQEQPRLRLEGLISDPATLNGRGTTDRQFLYINKRPVTNGKLAKTINQVYRAYSPKQYPVFFLNIACSTDSYDLNVTPDKRTIFLHDENAFIERIREQFTELFEPSRGRFRVSQSLSVRQSDSADLVDVEGAGIPKPSLSHHSPERPSEKRLPDLMQFASSPSKRFASAITGQTSAQRDALWSRNYNVDNDKAFSEASVRKYADQLAIAGLLIRNNVGKEGKMSKRERIKARYMRQSEVEKQYQCVEQQEKFESGLLDSDSKAVQEFERFIKKQDFKDMRVLGQFNCGFIVVLHNAKDLFVIDQHASDEKFNYERICLEHPVQTQQLIKPLKLELSINDELTVLDNLQVLKRNGFTISHDKTTNELYLRTCPVTKRGNLGISDLEELLYRLSQKPAQAENECYIKGENGQLSCCESHRTVYMPNKKPLLLCTKLQAMFANMACRCSIMIGTALSQKTMEKVVSNLSHLEQPWNCPHGRPTMRHIYDLKNIYKNID